MRLTLRTMLAYLDDILDPEDSKALGAKVDESEFATALVHRIRNCTRRLRLGAPKLDGKGMGLDANTVAEYLDNTLPQDRVPDFEKVCLESDVHLAEVASSHQILTLVLGEPATVEPHLRDRIYQLPSATLADAAAPPIAAMDEPPVPSSTNGSAAVVEKPAILAKRPEVPDYLRVARRRSWTPIAATVTLALLLILAALLAVGRFDESHPLLGRFFAKRTDREVASDANGSARSRTTTRTQTTVTTDDDTSRPANDLVAADTESSTSESEMSDAMEEQAVIDNGADEVDIHVNVTEVPESGDLETDAEITTDDATVTITETESTTAESTVAAATTDESTTAESAIDVETSPDSAPDSATAEATTSDSTTTEDVSPATATEVGRYIAGDRKHVLSRLDPEQGWLRLPEREVLHAGDHLLALPSYRPQVALTSGVQMTVVGPSRVTLDAPDEMNAPVLRLTNATALIDTVGVAGSQIVIEFPGRRAQITFATPDATLAVQVHRDWPLGSDPLEEEAVYGCRLMATNGQLQWREGDDPPLTINSGQMLQAVGAATPQIVDASKIPDWVSNTEVRDIELRASRELETMIDPARSLTLSLTERIDHRQVEVAGLAIASLCAMEEFGPTLAAFRDDRFHSYWKSLYDRIQWALSGDTTAAERLLAALQKDRPDDAATLYRLVCGYNNAQLEAGEDKRLVNLLESRSMDVRVLAFENLRRMTERTGNYRPEKDPTQQRRALQDWQNMLEKKQIRWRTESAGG